MRRTKRNSKREATLDMSKRREMVLSWSFLGITGRHLWLQPEAPVALQSVFCSAREQLRLGTAEVRDSRSTRTLAGVGRAFACVDV